MTDTEKFPKYFQYCRSRQGEEEKVNDAYVYGAPFHQRSRCK